MCSRRRIVLEGVRYIRNCETQKPAKLRCPDRLGNFEMGEKKLLYDLSGQRGDEHVSFSAAPVRLAAAVVSVVWAYNVKSDICEEAEKIL